MSGITGTNLFTVAASDIYTEALALCGIYDPSVNIQPADQTTCMFSLNVMCKAMVSKGLPLWTVQEITVPMVQGTTTYTVGTANIFPLRILQAYIRDSNGNDTILEVVSRYEYNTNGAKTTQSTPNQLFYDPQLAAQTITVFGAPPDATTTIHLVIQRQFYDFTLTSDNPDFPQEAYLMLCYGLADMISLKYRVKAQERQEIALKAKIYKEEFFANQQDYVPIQITPGDDFGMNNLGAEL